MERRILKKFGMNRSCVIREHIPDENISLAYSAAKSGVAMNVPEPPWEESPFAAGGGIRSCVGSLSSEKLIVRRQISKGDLLSKML